MCFAESECFAVVRENEGSGVSSQLHLGLITPPRFHNPVRLRHNLPSLDSYRDRRGCNEADFIWMVQVSRLRHREFEGNTDCSTRKHAVFELNGSAAGVKINSIDRASRRWLTSLIAMKQRHSFSPTDRQLTFLAAGLSMSSCAAATHRQPIGRQCLQSQLKIRRARSKKLASAEECRRVARRVSFTTSSASFFALDDLGPIFVPSSRRRDLNSPFITTLNLGHRY